MSANKNDPYAKATNAYDSHAQAHTTNQRELEGRILLKSNRMLQTLIDNWDKRARDALGDALTYNRQIWMLFFDTAMEDKGEDHTIDLRNNIVNLANFIFKRELEILADPKKEKLNILISINREIAAGLMVNNEAQSPEEQTEHSQQSSVRSTDISG